MSWADEYPQIREGLAGLMGAVAENFAHAPGINETVVMFEARVIAMEPIDASKALTDLGLRMLRYGQAVVRGESAVALANFAEAMEILEGPKAT